MTFAKKEKKEKERSKEKTVNKCDNHKLQGKMSLSLNWIDCVVQN